MGQTVSRSEGADRGAWYAVTEKAGNPSGDCLSAQLSVKVWCRRSAR